MLSLKVFLLLRKREASKLFSDGQCCLPDDGDTCPYFCKR
jgi:hypothetical protein